MEETSVPKLQPESVVLRGGTMFEKKIAPITIVKIVGPKGQVIYKADISSVIHITDDGRAIVVDETSKAKSTQD
jgi:hypothetical protein